MSASISTKTDTPEVQYCQNNEVRLHAGVDQKLHRYISVVSPLLNLLYFSVYFTRTVLVYPPGLVLSCPEAKHPDGFPTTSTSTFINISLLALQFDCPAQSTLNQKAARSLDLGHL
ncbi:hypothetical protein VTL71DRAFT_1077 [Oculimacula yallundae]|uniref:Uncharacterized protein n=1 Tax=Oculimacula yallundae TaxID=86028 RepID=A0ABR4D1V2_9HELO